MIEEGQIVLLRFPYADGGGHNRSFGCQIAPLAQVTPSPNPDPSAGN